VTDFIEAYFQVQKSRKKGSPCGSDLRRCFHPVAFGNWENVTGQWLSESLTPYRSVDSSGCRRRFRIFDPDPGFRRSLMRFFVTFYHWKAPPRIQFL
jgi:hypothetical protein